MNKTKSKRSKSKRTIKKIKNKMIR